MTGGVSTCKTCAGRRRLSHRLQHRRRVVLLPHEWRARRVPVPLLGVQLPVRLLEPFLPLLHGPPDAVQSAAALGRPTLHLPGGRRAEDRKPGGLDGPHGCSCSKARPALLAPPVLQATRSGLARDRALPDGHRCLARRGLGLRRLRRRALQPMRRDRPDLHECRLPVQDLRRRRRLRAPVPDLGRVVLLPDLGPHRLPDSLLGVQLSSGLPEPQLPLLRATTYAVQSPAALGRPAVHVSAARRAAPEPDLVAAQDSRMKP